MTFLCAHECGVVGSRKKVEVCGGHLHCMRKKRKLIQAPEKLLEKPLRPHIIEN